MIAISALMSAPDALYLDYERKDAHTSGPRMVRTRTPRPMRDKTRIIKTRRLQVCAL